MRKIICFIVCFFAVIDTSWALSMNCPEVASPGEIMKVHLEEDSYNGVKAKYNFNSGFVFHDMSLNSFWKSYYDGIGGFSVGNVINQDKLEMNINIKIDMNVQINKDYVLELVDIEANNGEYKSVSLDNLSCRVNIVSDVNTLESLIVDKVTLSPKFDKNVTIYKGTTTDDKIVIKAVASDNNAKIEGDIGEKNLRIGINTFNIKVTSSRGNIREYKVYITRKIDKKSSDVTLKSLTLSEGKLDFKKDTFLYFVDVDYLIDSVEVDAIANDSKAKVEILKDDKLIVGENTINVIVTAEDGTTATYVIVVNRLEKKSEDATIKDINIKNYDINFKSDVYEYQLKIDNEDKLDIEVILNDNKSKYTIKGNNNLKNNSIIEIEVRAENGNTKIYKINIKQLIEDNSMSLNNYVKLIPLILFVVLVIVILIIKVLKSRVVKN